MDVEPVVEQEPTPVPEPVAPVEPESKYKNRGRKIRTEKQLAVLAEARKKALLVIQERAKINAKDGRDSEPVADATPVPEPVAVATPEPEPVAPPTVPPVTREEILKMIQEPRKKYKYMRGVYVRHGGVPHK